MISYRKDSVLAKYFLQLVCKEDIACHFYMKYLKTITLFSTACPLGFYGSNCISQCNCEVSMCNAEIGCEINARCHPGYKENFCQGNMKALMEGSFKFESDDGDAGSAT